MRILKYHFIVLLTLCCCHTVTAQFEIPDKPSFQTSIYDNINLLSASESDALEQKLIQYSDTTSTQIVVAIIASTKGENIMYLGAQWADRWGIGQAEEDNGIFILLAKEDRKIAINTGYGVEHLLTDAMSKRIIERDIIPYFKRQDYYGGLDRGTDAIFEVMTGEYLGSRQVNSTPFPFFIFILLFIIFLIILVALIKSRGGGNSGNRGKRSGGTSIWDAIILSNMGRGSYGGGFGSSSGGGFSSGGFGGGFGGGGFGGGGASGGW